MTRRNNPMRSAAIRAATTEAGATQYRRSIGDRIAATVAGLVELLAGLVLTILLVIAVLFGAAALGEALGSPLYHGWPSPRAAIPGCLHRLLRGFRRIDSLAWPSIGYTLIWLYAGCGLSLGGLWVAYSCVCDDPGASIGAPLLSFQ